MTSPSRDTRQEAKLAVREWQPHMWEGMDFFAWLRLLIKNRFRVHWPYLYVAVIVTFVSLFMHTFLRLVQQAIYGRRIARTRLTKPPIFIIGHWRTGTTLLHELLILDERHSYPTTYECLESNHFLLTERLLTRWCGFLMPSRRPMDNMKAGFDRPQEDEFALCMMGLPSPYLTIAFPANGPVYEEYFTLDGLSPKAERRWRRGFQKFLKTLTFKDPRRLILKSPPHTFRIKVLTDMFPDAIFIHLVRDPYVLFPSTVHMWRTLAERHGLQRPHMPWLEEFVFKTFIQLHDRLETTRGLVAPARYYELRYEDLVADPIGQLQELYTRLQLGGFDDVLPRLKEYVDELQEYQTNHYQMIPQQRADITRRWGHIIERQGYAPRAAVAQAATRHEVEPLTVK